jgi:hypothetical protein
VAGPAGRQVGQVSIRVVPDTDGFRRDLQRELNEIEHSLELTIPVKFDVDTAALRAQLEALNPEVTIPVDFDVDTAGLRAQLETLQNARIDIPVNLDLDTGALQAELAALDRFSVNIDVSVDGLDEAVASLTSL